ncbi:MAG: RHS repeat protein [Deltaproteobacteria bacterium]|nr:RHS repeat protein [Deltaproteobacteria bacterium]
MKALDRCLAGVVAAVVLVLSLTAAERTASGQDCLTSGLTCTYNVHEMWGTACYGGDLFRCFHAEMRDISYCDRCDGVGDCVEVWDREAEPGMTCGPPYEDPCKGNDCSDYQGEPCAAGCREEECNGYDDDGDGIIDNVVDCGDTDDGDGGGGGMGVDDPPLAREPEEDCPENDPECDCSDDSANTHLTTGVMALSPQVDVELDGPGRFSAGLVRYYASQYSNRYKLNYFGRGFTSNLNERLEGDLATPAAVIWVRPGGTGVGHATCTQQGAEWSCVPQVNRHHALRRLSDQSWRLTELGGTGTTFDSQGRLTGKHDGTTGWGYTLGFDGSGHVLSLSDSAGRTLAFVHDAAYEFLTGRDRITRVELQRSPTNIILAEYGYSEGRLVSVTRPTGTRTYEYVPSDAPGITAVRENSGSTTLETHEFDESRRPIESRTAHDASGFRYDVTCNAGGPPGVLLFDLTAPETDGGSPKSCTSDAQCSGGAACHIDGYCYWYSCLEYDPDRMNAVTSITGNCECSGTAQSSWTSGMRLAWRTDRNGVRTTYEYDSNGLEIAKCENDSDTTVTRADPNSCPAAGRWEGTWYSATWPGKPIERRRKSTLSPTGNVQVLYTYDSYGRLDLETHNGFTRSGSDTIVSYSYVTNWDYDSLGRLTRVDGPISGSSDRVEYTYYSSGNGDSSYMLQRVRRYTSASAYLDTTYAAYDPYGRATQVTGPNGTTTTYTFDMYGRVLTETAAGLTTSYSYDDGGRLARAATSSFTATTSGAGCPRSPGATTPP